MGIHGASCTQQFNVPYSQIEQYACSISKNAPVRTEMCIVLFWMEHFEIWNRGILGFLKLFYSRNRFYRCHHLNTCKYMDINFTHRPSIYVCILLSSVTNVCVMQASINILLLRQLVVLDLEVASSIPAGSTIIYRFLCGFKHVFMCQSIKSKPTNTFVYYWMVNAAVAYADVRCTLW